MTFAAHNSDDDPTSTLSDVCSSLCTALLQQSSHHNPQDHHHHQQPQQQHKQQQVSAFVEHVETQLLPRCFSSLSPLLCSLQLFPAATHSNGGNNSRSHLTAAAGFSLADPNIRKQVQQARLQLETFRCDGARLWNAAEQLEQQQLQQQSQNNDSVDMMMTMMIPVVLLRVRCIAAELAVASLPKPCSLWRDAGVLSASAVLEATWMMMKAADAIIDGLQHQQQQKQGNNSNTSSHHQERFLLQRADQYLERIWSLATSSSASSMTTRACLSPVALERLNSLACDAAASSVQLMLLLEQLQRCTAHINGSVESMQRLFPAPLAIQFVERAAHAVICSAKSRYHARNAVNNNKSSPDKNPVLKPFINLCIAVSKQLQPLVSRASSLLSSSIFGGGVGFCMLQARLSLVTAEHFFLCAKEIVIVDTTSTAPTAAACSSQDGAPTISNNNNTKTTNNTDIINKQLQLVEEKNALLGEALSFATASEVQCRQAAVLPTTATAIATGANYESSSSSFSIERVTAHVFQLRARVHCEIYKHSSKSNPAAAFDALVALNSLQDVAESFSQTTTVTVAVQPNRSRGSSSCGGDDDRLDVRFAHDTFEQVAAGVHRLCLTATTMTTTDDHNNDDDGEEQKKKKKPVAEIRHTAELLSRSVALLFRVFQQKQKQRQQQERSHKTPPSSDHLLLVFWLCRLLTVIQKAPPSSDPQKLVNRSLIAAVLEKLETSAATTDSNNDSDEVQQLNPVSIDGADAAAITAATAFRNRHAQLEDLSRNFCLVWNVAQRALLELTEQNQNNNNNHNNKSPAAIDASTTLCLLRLASHYAVGCGVEQRCIALRALARAQLLLTADVTAAAKSLDAAQALVEHSPHTSLLRFQLHVAAQRQTRQNNNNNNNNRINNNSNNSQQHTECVIHAALNDDLDRISRGQKVSDVSEALSIAAQLAREAQMPTVCAVALRKMIDMGGDSVRLLSMLRAWVECGSDTRHSIADWIWCGDTASRLIFKLCANNNNNSNSNNNNNCDEQLLSLAMWWSTTLVQHASMLSAETTESIHNSSNNNNNSNNLKRETARLCSASAAICRRAIDASPPRPLATSTASRDDDEDETLDEEGRRSPSKPAASTAVATATTAVTVADLHQVLRWAALEYLSRLSDCFDVTGATSAAQSQRSDEVDDDDDQNYSDSAAPDEKNNNRQLHHHRNAINALMMQQRHIDESLMTIRAVKQSLCEEPTGGDGTAPTDDEDPELWQQLVAAEFVCVIAQLRIASGASSTPTDDHHSASMIITAHHGIDDGDSEGAALLTSLISEIVQGGKPPLRRNSNNNSSSSTTPTSLVNRALLLAALSRLAADSRLHAVALDAVEIGVFATVEAFVARASQAAAHNSNNNNHANQLQQQQQPVDDDDVLPLLLRSLFLFSTTFQDALDTACSTRDQQVTFAQSSIARATHICDAVFELVAAAVARMKKTNEAMTNNRLEGGGDNDDDAAGTETMRGGAEGYINNGDDVGLKLSDSNNSKSNRFDLTALQSLLSSIAASFRTVVCTLWNSAVFDINLGDADHAGLFVAALRTVGDSILKKLHRLSRSCATTSSSTSAFSAHVGFVEVLVAQFQAATVSVGANPAAATAGALPASQHHQQQQQQQQQNPAAEHRSGSLAAN